MAVSVVMPALEMAQETGKLVSWLKKEGEPVKKGEMLLEVETDKAVVEIEAGGDGILGGVTAKEGDVVPVGQTIGWLRYEHMLARPDRLYGVGLKSNYQGQGVALAKQFRR